ncbi:J domain-containing protein [Nocardiopsis sp. FIRDI 009]|uniref:J domain-containing protein n=1 Tax=Nocardiopsis sp. FIRDI 009 TaxID=714197 RepID=UPI000E21C696|nr:J domain-containing protein [Nocardiopsis sp. FIRDI 009]
MSTDQDATTPFDAALRSLALAGDPTALFGPAPEGGGAPPPTATAEYRRLARLVHPDRAPAGRSAEAAAAFTRLTESWSRYRDLVEGDLGLADLTLVTRARTYHVRRGSGPLARGDIADLHEVRYKDGGAWREAVLKLPRSHRDNDLVMAETTALRRIREKGHERYRAFRPELVEQIRHRDAATGVERRGNVLGRLGGFHSLADVRRARPDGIDPRDAAWMWRRLLVAIGDAARAGVVHGAVVPEHVLIHPELHGLVLIDWCYSVTFGAARTAPHIPAMVAHRGDLYPPEVGDRKPAVPATDVFMATRCVEYVTAGRLPRRLRAFARGCRLPDPRRRPGDGLALLDELDEALEREFGPRRFRPFHLSAPTPADPR